MNRRELLAGTAIGLTTVAAGCVGSASEDATSYGAAPAETENEIAVSARGEVETEPDRASLRVGIEASGESADEVNDELAERAEELRAAFDDLAIPEENVESGRYDVRERRQGTGFEGRHTFQIDLDDPDRVGEVIDGVVEAGADNVGRVNFGLSDAAREKLREEALEHAFETADAEAEAIAANRGVEITGTRSVRTTNVDVAPVRPGSSYMVEADVADDGGAPPTDVDGGLVTVNAQVEVVYTFE